MDHIIISRRNYDATVCQMEKKKPQAKEIVGDKTDRRRP